MTTQKAKKTKTKIDPADYVDFARMLVPKYGKVYMPIFRYGKLLSYAYEAMVIACRSYDGTTPLKSWITLKVRKSFPELARDEDILKRNQREWFAKRGFENPVLVNIDEVPLSTNGYEVQRMIDQQHIRFLVKKARLTESMKRRLNLRFFEGYKMLEIAKMEGITESAVSGSIRQALKKLRSVSRRRKICDSW